MLRRVWLRAASGRSWLGQWTPALVLALCTTATTVFFSVVPHWYDMERYWLAWLGERLLHGELPRAAGLESPYDFGHSWMPVEWLYALCVAWTRERGVFWLFAGLNGLCGAAIVWWALGASVVRRVPGNVTFVIVGACCLPVVQRYEVRAEAIGSALVVAVLACGNAKTTRWILVPLFAAWANLHPSFAFGLLVLALQTIDGVRRGDRMALGVFAACAIATLCTPFGIALWPHIWWTSHGWIAHTVPEWQPLLQSAPFGVFLLLIPAISFLQREKVRRRGLTDWALWPITSALAVSSQRFLALAIGIGAPLGCGLFRQRDVPAPRWSVWLALLGVLWLGWHGFAGDVRQLAGGTSFDRDFGLVIARSSPAVVEHAVDLRGKLVSCVPGWYCNVALYLGARTLYDGRTEPFSAQRIADLSASLEDPSVLRRWPVDVAMVSPNDAPALRAAGWREIAGSQFIAIFRR